MKTSKTSVGLIVVQLLLIGNILLNTSCGQSKADLTDKINKIEKLIETYANYERFSGSILVADGGEVIYKSAWGIANREWNIPNQVNTKHRLASISKQFTAMLIMQQVAAGKLSLDESILSYLPDDVSKHWEKVTLHHLLTHTSGIPSYTSFPNYRELMRKPISPEKIIALFADSSLNFIPGESFEYSNSGYALLGYILEETTEKSYGELLKENIFVPLKMENSGYYESSKILENSSSGYFKNGQTYLKSAYIDLSIAYSAGGIYATVEDLFLWEQALYNDKLLPKEYREQLFEPHVSAWNGHYAYGWEIGKIQIGSSGEELSTIAHSGGINGYHTLITRIPSSHSSIILLNNTSSAPLYEISVAITGILNNKSYSYPQKSLADGLATILSEEGVEQASVFYKEHRYSTSYYLDEDEMNLLGYDLLRNNDNEKAILVFGLNIEAFPHSFNVYDSYGEAMMKVGQDSIAIENYQKSIQMNPANKNGVRMLEKLGVSPVEENMLSVDQLKLYEGEYVEESNLRNEDWRIKIRIEEGKLWAKDGDRKFQLIANTEYEFVNPMDGTVLIFQSKDARITGFTGFGNLNFKKME